MGRSKRGVTPRAANMAVKEEDTTQANSHSNSNSEMANSAKSIGTSSLDALQNAESRKVMDIVDRLRRSGLGGILQLPQLVVSGDQSSGKSSVLEAITEIPFPRKENLCTRFATEIIMRRAPTPSISTKIIPDKQRPETEKKRLEGFTSSIKDFSELPNLVEEATNFMGLGDDTSEPVRAFSRDVLSIEIAGPGRPHLTLVDLPGLIHSENKMQSKEDVELIRGLVDDYIKEKRTIIMAVVSAKNDYANQIILKKCRDVDPMGHRTLGIVTKPDFLEPDSENENSWIELANNHDIFFHLGWHILRNRSDKEINMSFDERNAAEKVFFSKGRYRDLPGETLGIASLRNRLSQLLFKHLKTELPSLQKELNDKLKDVCHELGLLGEKRSTPQEQRRFLTTMSSNYQEIVKAAVNGQYEHSNFFGDLDPEQSLDHQSNIRRLRATVQHLNLHFSKVMRKYGHTEEVLDRQVKPSDFNNIGNQEIDQQYVQFASLQKEVSREDAVQRVKNILIRSRGRELPGTFNPLLISQLFWDQSKNWKSIADYHVERVAEVCSIFVQDAMKFSVAEDVSARLQSLKVDGVLQKQISCAKAELDRIIADAKHHPITYDPSYTAIMQAQKHEKLSSKLDKLIKDAEENGEQGRESTRYLNPEVFKDGKGVLFEPDMDQTSAEDALDAQLAYYKDEVNYFIGTVTKQVIERHLLRNLAQHTLSPLIVVEMTDDEVGYIAAEPEETTRERDFLEARKATLEKGQQTFKSALGLFR